MFVLFKGGRLPSWHRLDASTRDAYERDHVDLMLDVGALHGLRRIEGFRLVGAQEPWQRFWVIEFPDFAGAEAWIEAERRPPYGAHGFYEYHLARSWGADYLPSWLPPGTPSRDAAAGASDRLEVDRQSFVVLGFARMQPASEALTAQERGDAAHVEQMCQVAAAHGMIHVEAFQLINVQHDWHRAWIFEFPTIEGAEAWMEAEVDAPYVAHGRKSLFLARRWASGYFRSWPSRGHVRSGSPG